MWNSDKGNCEKFKSKLRNYLFCSIQIQVPINQDSPEKFTTLESGKILFERKYFSIIEIQKFVWVIFLLFLYLIRLSSIGCGGRIIMVTSIVCIRNTNTDQFINNVTDFLQKMYFEEKYIIFVGDLKTNSLKIQTNRIFGQSTGYSRLQRAEMVNCMFLGHWSSSVWYN